MDEFNVKIDDLGVCVKNVCNELVLFGFISIDFLVVEK